MSDDKRSLESLIKFTSGMHSVYPSEYRGQVLEFLQELSRLRADCKRKDEALDKTRIAVAWLMERVTDDPGLHHALSNLVTNITAALADSDTTKGGG